MTTAPSLPLLSTGGDNDSHRDRWRQWLNLLLAVGQPVTTYFTFADGGFPDDPGSDTFVTPAGYAFIIWSLIYALCLAYGIFQFLPSQRANPLLRKIGFPTAGTFLFTSLWLIAARSAFLWGTVACIVAMLVCLLRAFVPVFTERVSLSRAERWLVLPPVSIFTGWVTVATVANTASALKASGFSGILLSDQGWAILMLLAAGGIAAAMTRLSRGYPGYALTVLWAFTAIVAANLMTTMYAPPVAATAAIAALAVAFAAVMAKKATPGSGSSGGSGFLRPGSSA